MVRCYAAQNDPEGLGKLLGELCRLGHSITAYTWNRALAACSGSNSALDLAEVLVDAGICKEGLDAVGYNTLMKYNARAGRVARCFQLRTDMQANGVEASEITFGTLLDACVSAKELDRAREVFDDLCTSGLQLNVVHCTTFIKVFVGAGRLDEAAGVLHEMLRSPGVKPDLITYSTLVKAYSESGEVLSALKMLELMLKEGVKPDLLIFNSVLGGCYTYPLKPAYVIGTFDKLLGHGMKPNTTTLSILLKGLTHSEAWPVSLQVLKDAPTRFGFEPEERLYVQLAQSCIKARDAKTETVLEVYDAMLKGARRQGKVVDPIAVGRLLRSCVLGGQLEAAGKMWERARQSDIPIDAPLEKMLRTALAKKHLGVRRVACAGS